MEHVQISVPTTNDSFYFHYNRSLSTNMSKPHLHDTYEIYYLISGQRRYFIEDEIYDIYPGDMILIPPKCPHKVLNTPNISTQEYHERYLICPSVEDIPEVFIHLFDNHFYHLTGDDKSAIIECLDSLYANYSKHDKYTFYHNHSNLLKILCTLARLPLSGRNPHQLSTRDLKMQDAALYIKNNCSQSLTLSLVAEKYNFSREYFCSCFKKSTGFGFNEYLNQMRISKAVELLNTTTLSVTEISSICGYNDSNYFTYIFKKTMGDTPKRFRPTIIKETRM